MPRYDYECTSCGRRLEVVHRIEEAGPRSCEVCGGALRKAFVPPAIHFRGSGWAKKDARQSGAKPASATKPAADKPAAAGDAAEAGTPVAVEKNGGPATPSTSSAGAD